MSPGIETRLLSDDFTEDALWDTAVSSQGSAAIANNRLSLAVQPGVYLASMRRELNLDDFYAEITAHPSLCRGDDNYGVIVRGVGSSFYRFVLTCNGEIRAERISGGTRLPIYDPVPSGDAPRPPGDVRIGMWAVGDEMRLFLNGRYQFSVVEPTFPSGDAPPGAPGQVRLGVWVAGAEMRFFLNGRYEFSVIDPVFKVLLDANGRLLKQKIGPFAEGEIEAWAR